MKNTSTGTKTISYALKNKPVITSIVSEKDLTRCIRYFIQYRLPVNRQYFHLEVHYRANPGSRQIDVCSF